jgi:hypothetical protein
MELKNEEARTWEGGSHSKCPPILEQPMTACEDWDGSCYRFDVESLSRFNPRGVSFGAVVNTFQARLSMQDDAATSVVVVVGKMKVSTLNSCGAKCSRRGTFSCVDIFLACHSFQSRLWESLIHDWNLRATPSCQHLGLLPFSHSELLCNEVMQRAQSHETTPKASGDKFQAVLWATGGYCASVARDGRS